MSESSEVTRKYPKWASDCAICQVIWQRFADPKFTHQVKLGTFEEIHSTKCPFHKPLAGTLVEHVHKINDQITSDHVEIIPSRAGRNVQIQATTSGYLLGLCLIKKASIPNHPGTGRILDPDWVDLDMLKKWKKTCLTSHGTKCENPMKVWPARPAWLIDVEEKCLVPGLVPGRFVALSYTYGNHGAPQIDANTLQRLQKPHALETGDLSEYLTPIVRHGMYLTSVIGERYLWADALCITHHDRAAMAEQLKLMGAIYANAVATIISSDNFSESGLPGLKGISSSRGMKQAIIPFGDERLLVRNTTLSGFQNSFPYDERGWTYQEYKMAQRRIIFDNKEIHWECQCDVWHEEAGLNAEIGQFRYIDPGPKVILAGFPDIHSLSDIISTYNTRKLRYDEDALPGISGLLSVFSRSFKGGFLYGIPEMLFECGLRWRPEYDHTNLRRRLRSEKPPGTLLTPSGLPSWSWVGWQGNVCMGESEADRVSYYSDWIKETMPITQWYTSQSPTDPPSERRKIKPTWFADRASYKDFTKPVPPGWTRHDAPATFHGEPYLSPDMCEKYLFKHPALLDDHDDAIDAWFYPFTVPEINECTPPFTPEQTQYLFCETSKARLSGYQAGDGNLTNLYTSSGERIGQLFLHNEDALALFPVSTAKSKKGLLVDLVAICKERKYSKTWNEEQGIYEGPFKKSDLYAVLWVEWKDGIAYRLASGEVEAVAWEKLDLEPVSLILG